MPKKGKKRRLHRRSAAAKVLETALFRLRIVKSRRKYKREKSVETEE